MILKVLRDFLAGLDLQDRLARSKFTSGVTRPVKIHFKVATFYTFWVDNMSG